MKFTLVLILAILVTYGTGGCSTAKGNRGTAKVVLLNSGHMVLDNKRMPAADLPQRLRKKGYKPGRSMIQVSISDGTPEPAIRRAAKELASGGYKRVIFVTPRHVSVETDSPGLH